MFKKSENANQNYLAKIVKLGVSIKHKNADKLQCFIVDGCSVITGLSAKEGDVYVYFPVECAINSEYLAYSNSFSDAEMNEDKTQKGFFNKYGRVRAIRLRGEKSEGYIVPVLDFFEWLSKKSGKKLTFADAEVDVEFDYFDDVMICEKYVNREVLRQQALSEAREKKKGKVARQSKLIEGQFRFHIDTAHLSKNIHNIEPNDLISITNKIHGTSFIVGKVLCVKPLKWHERLLKKLGVAIVDNHYDIVYSSRKVVKNKYNDVSGKEHFYGYDIWEDISKQLDPVLTETMTIYGEAAGYTKTGGFIQKNFDYGCAVGEFKIFVYRITLTNASGKVFEFSAKQVKEYCAKFGLNYVPEYYYGYAKDLFPEISVTEHWKENFLTKLTDTYLEKDCDMCVNKVPAEGIVLRREVSDIDVYKHKSFRFKEYESKELDSGEVDMETQESFAHESA
jgi:hypothetical protein